MYSLSTPPVVVVVPTDRSRAHTYVPISYVGRGLATYVVGYTYSPWWTVWVVGGTSCASLVRKNFKRHRKAVPYYSVIP